MRHYDGLCDWCGEKIVMICQLGSGFCSQQCANNYEGEYGNASDTP